MEKDDLKREFISYVKSKRNFNIPELHNASKDADYTEWLENKLCHNIDATAGLYAIDFNPKELIKRFVDSQSDATILLTEDVDRLVKDWEKWINNENINKSPFDQIKWD